MLVTDARWYDSEPMSRFSSYKTFIDALNSELESFPVDKPNQMRIITRSSTQNKATNDQIIKKKGFKSDAHFPIPRTQARWYDSDALESHLKHDLLIQLT